MWLGMGEGNAHSCGVTLWNKTGAPEGTWMDFYMPEVMSRVWDRVNLKRLEKNAVRATEPQVFVSILYKY